MEDTEKQLWFMLSERDLHQVLTAAAEGKMAVEEIVSEIMMAAAWHDFSQEV